MFTYNSSVNFQIYEKCRYFQFSIYKITQSKSAQAQGAQYIAAR